MIGGYAIWYLDALDGPGRHSMGHDGERMLTNI
jgi:hypothetical protein